MKTHTYVATILCALILAAVAHGQQAVPLPAPRAGFSFPQRQTLTYSVDWRVFPAGTAVLHFENQGDRERLTANADTVGALNLVFHVADRFQSTFDRNKGCTYDFAKADRRGSPPDQLHAAFGLRPGQVHPGREEHGHRPDQASGAAHRRLPHRPADGGLLRLVAAHGGGPFLRHSGGRCSENRAGHHEGGRPRRDQDHPGNLQNPCACNPSLPRAW